MHIMQYVGTCTYDCTAQTDLLITRVARNMNMRAYYRNNVISKSLILQFFMRSYLGFITDT
jgi:ribosomal protein S8E